MNGLSWLFYFGDVAGNLGFIGGTGTVACIGTAAGCLLVGGVMRGDAGYSWNSKKDLEGAGKALQRKAIPLVIAAGILAVLSAGIPSRNTIMLIAAAEVGETLLASKDVQAIGGEAGALASDSLKLLRKYVNEQLGEGDAK